MLKIGLWGIFCCIELSHSLYGATCITCQTCGEKFVRWRNFRFLCVMWRNLIFLHMGSIFKYRHMKDVDKSKISPHLAYMCDEENGSTCVKFMLFCCKIGFVAIYTLLSQIFVVAIYAFLCGEKINQQLRSWRKIDKYQVWVPYILYIYNITMLQSKLCCNTATNTKII